MKGRKPLPSKVKKLAGNPGKRALRPEPKPKGGELRRPAWMTGYARAMWERIIGAWRGTGVLTGADQGALEAYCAAYGRFVAAQADVEAHGLTLTDNFDNVKKNPAVTVLGEAVAQMRSLGAEMGLTPSARARLAAAPSDTADEFEKFRMADAS